MKGLTYAELVERKKNLQLRVKPQPTPAPLSEYEQKAVDEFHRECKAMNPLAALRQIDDAFKHWFAEYGEMTNAGDVAFAEKMMSILESVLGKPSADRAFDADARNEAK
jgi:hypothetical protein